MMLNNVNNIIYTQLSNINKKYISFSIFSDNNIQINQNYKLCNMCIAHRQEII